MTHGNTLKYNDYCTNAPLPVFSANIFLHLPNFFATLRGARGVQAVFPPYGRVNPGVRRREQAEYGALTAPVVFFNNLKFQ